MKLERIVDFSPAFDKRHKDPKKNYGIGAVLIRFVLKGEMREVDIDVSQLVHAQVGNFQSYKSKLINKNGKPTIRLWIGDLVELDEVEE